MSRLIQEAHSIIGELMETQRVTKSELARRLGTSVSNVSQLLATNRNLTIKMFEKIVKCLGEQPAIFLSQGDSLSPSDERSVNEFMDKNEDLMDDLAGTGENNE